MSKFMYFILFNIFMYIVYIALDTLFTFFHWYSNPQLGHDMMVMPTSNDIWLITANTLLSSMVAFYVLFKMKENL